MSLGFLFGGGVVTEVRGTEMYRSYPVMRDLCEQVSDWTGLTVCRSGGGTADRAGGAAERGDGPGDRAGAGIPDVLVEHGLRPSAFGGLSLGAMTASCLAGAIGRRELFEMLAHTRHTPELPPEAPEQGLALAFSPVEGDLVAVYRGEGRPGGPRWPCCRTDRPIAVHSPVRGHHRDFMAPYVQAMPFTAPELPLFSCLEEKKLTAAEEVRDLFDRNSTDATGLVDGCAGVKAEGVRPALITGGSIPDGILRFPFPVAPT